MAGPKLAAGDVPTAHPWFVRGEADEGAPAVERMLGVEPATNERPGGWPYLIRQDRPVEPGGSLLHIATGIQRLADAKLMVAAPDLADVLLALLIAPELGSAALSPTTRRAVNTAWGLLVRAAPHLEI